MSAVASLIPVVGLDHVVLRVRDLDAMLAFYRDTLGCAVERELDVGLVQLRAGASLIDLVPVESELGRKGGGPPGEEARNMDHFCVQVEPFDEAAIRAALARRGYRAGPVEARYGARGDGPSIYVEDPEGNTVELKGPPFGAEAEPSDAPSLQRMEGGSVPPPVGAGAGAADAQRQQQQQ